MTAYVLNSDSVTPIRTDTGTAGKPIKIAVPGPPEILGAMAITPDGKTVYVANHGFDTAPADTVIPISTATSKVGKAITVGESPDAIAITPDGKTAYVVNQSGTVTPIRTATNTALKAIAVGSNPRAIAITPDGKTAYVANFNSGTVTPIRTATG
ncbi:MAG: YncE family protein, partial [Streptosporangiaceae bacterium]